MDPFKGGKDEKAEYTDAVSYGHASSVHVVVSFNLTATAMEFTTHQRTSFL